MKTFIQSIHHLSMYRCIAFLKFNLYALALVCCSSCSEFLEVEPPSTQLVTETVYDSDATTIAAMSGIYRQMTNGVTGGGINSITVLAGLMSDELTGLSGAGSNAIELYDNNVLPSNPVVGSLWAESYALIFQCNAVLDGVSKSTKLSPIVKQTLEGEARFVRAFLHFYLVNMFGEVPYIETTDYRVNRVVPRTEINEAYDRIVSDLTLAYDLMYDTYAAANNERAKPVRWAAAALLARVHLYTGNWDEARQWATLVISNASLFGLEPELDNVFKKNSKEAIFQLLTSSGLNYTNEASIFLRTPTYVSLPDNIVSAFTEDDLRLERWISSITNPTGTYYYPYKYREAPGEGTGAEYSMVMRLAEQYLIRAEANARLGDLNASIEDIDAIRGRAGLQLLKDTNPGISQSDLFAEIEQQRMLELFTEWGHRWFDLKRTGRASDVLGPIKPNWNETDQLLPLPEKEILANSNLLPQNPGY